MKELCERLGIDEADLLSAVDEDLRGMPGVVMSGFDLTEVPGGASVRGYCRVRLEGASGLSSMVLMVLSDPDPAKGVEEVMAEGKIEEQPFLNVQRHLAASGVPVPEIYYYNRDRGLIYLEDLGKEHLRDVVERGDEAKTREAFEEAIRELIKIQVDATEMESDDFLGFMVKFDRKLLRWELDHFTEYAIKSRFPDAPSKEDDGRIAEHFEAITEELLSSPYALQHRDYHMDNLLFKDGGIKVIDFQDALMGPVAYDLACLLYDRDTSFLLGKELIGLLVNYYTDELGKRSGESIDRKKFQRVFELCVIHRMLKVVGRFHFIDQVKKRPEYLHFNQYMLPAIVDYLGRDDRGKDLLSIIVKYLPEISEFVEQ